MPSYKKRVKDVDNHLESLGVAEEKVSYDVLSKRYAELMKMHVDQTAELEKLKAAQPILPVEFCDWEISHDADDNSITIACETKEHWLDTPSLEEIDDLINFLTQVKERL